MEPYQDYCDFLFSYASRLWDVPQQNMTSSDIGIHHPTKGLRREEYLQVSRLGPKANFSHRPFAITLMTCGYVDQ